MKYLLIFAAMFLACNLFAQHKYDYTWIFGSQFGKVGVLLNFNDAPARVQIDTFFAVLRSGVSFINSEEGVLKYYTTGCQIYASTHELVQGAEIVASHSFDYQNFCKENVLWYPHGDQGMVFIPFGDGNYKVFYKLRNTYTNDKGETKLIFDTLYMASILNGAAEYVDKAVYVDTLSFANIAVVRHSNNLDYWVVTPHDSSDVYVALQVGAGGVLDTVLSNISEIIRRNHNGVIARFSPDGLIYIGFEHTYTSQAFKVMSFDRSAGVLEYLYDMPHPEGVSTSNIGGIEFSASGRYLYCSTPHHIYQYDMEASDVAASKTLVASWDNPSPQGAIFHVMQRGPDCRIYINSPNSQSFLHVIMYPDRPGLACEVVQAGLPLPYKHQGSMPYFTNFRLGTGESVCDSTLSLPTAIPAVFLPDDGLRVWPNPARTQVWVGLSEALAREATFLTLYDLIGRPVWREAYAGVDTVAIDLQSLSPGMYFLQVQGRDGRLWVEKVLVE